MNQPDYLFLIGGSDLEMATIKRLLTANGFADGQNIADHNLTWSGKLSLYQENFDFPYTFIDIEATHEIPTLSYLIYIYHFKECSKKVLSLVH
jgi:hypothetical protein